MRAAADHAGQQDGCGTLDQHRSSEIWAVAAAGGIAGRVQPLSCSRVPPHTARGGSKPGSAVPGPPLPRGGRGRGTALPRGVPLRGAARCRVLPGTLNQLWSGGEQRSHALENRERDFLKYCLNIFCKRQADFHKCFHYFSFCFNKRVSSKPSRWNPSQIYKTGVWVCSCFPGSVSPSLRPSRIIPHATSALS